MATKSESSSKAKASVKNIIKIAVGELKKKRKKRGRKRVKKPTPQQEVVTQTIGNLRNLASPAPPATLSGLLQIGREFRDVQLSQKQLTEQVGTRIRASERAIRDEVERQYRTMGRALGANQILTQAQERDIRRLTQQVETALRLAGRTAEGLEQFTTSGFLQQVVRTVVSSIAPKFLQGAIQGEEGGQFVGFKGGKPLEEAKKVLAKEGLAESAKKPAKQPTGGGQVGSGEMSMKGQGGGGQASLKGLTDEQLQQAIRRQYERDIESYKTSGKDGQRDLEGLKLFSQSLGVPQNAAKSFDGLVSRLLKADSAQFAAYGARMRAQYQTPLKQGGGLASQIEGFEEEDDESLARGEMFGGGDGY